jgi:heme/copper-type cytochrome/quinol oxidase subunit 1
VKRGGVKKTVFGLAMLVFAAALATLGAAAWALLNLGSAHMATPSLFATGFFLGCCGVVLYFVSKPQQPLPPE